MIHNSPFIIQGIFMSRNDLLRRVGILCCNFFRNMAFYRAGRVNNLHIDKSNFWNTVNGNFLDICILEWLKLFGERNGKQSWEKAITDKVLFKSNLLKSLELTEDGFNLYVLEMRTYRDKFVAHLDYDKTAQIPHLEIALKSVNYLYNYLLANEEESDCFFDAPPDALNYYKSILLEGQLIHSILAKGI